MNKLITKAKRAIRFLFYKDISIFDQIRISKILDDEQLEQLFWKMSKADRHHSLEVLERTMQYSNNENLLKLSRYFNKKFFEVTNFNLDLEIFFLEFKSKIINAK